jgi:hypothetical protein
MYIKVLIYAQTCKNTMMEFIEKGYKKQRKNDIIPEKLLNLRA